LLGRLDDLANARRIDGVGQRPFDLINTRQIESHFIGYQDLGWMILRYIE
jgi:hypothetical protein